MKKYLYSIAVSLVIISCTSTTAKINSDTKFERIVDLYHAFQDEINKDSGIQVSTSLPNLSKQSLFQNDRQLNDIYNQLINIDLKALSKKNQINYAVLQYVIKNQLDQYRYNAHYMPLTAESGFHVSVSRMFSNANLKTEQDYLDYISRLTQVPKYFKQQMAWMEKGIETGLTQPKEVLVGYEDSIAAFIKNDVKESVFYQPLKTMPKHFTPQTAAKLQQRAEQAIAEHVITSYKQYFDFMINRYKVKARDELAASLLPDGKAFYQNRIEHYTTLALTAQDIHDIGLKEVARIRAEMDDIIKSVNFHGSFKDFVAFLRTSPQFYAKTPEELLKEASFIAKKMDAQLPKLFKKLPRTPYGVAPVPANIAPKYTTGRYVWPSRDDQPGYYWVNTYQLDRRPLYVLEALTLHEAVPGHHLQNSLNKEMKGVPKFRNDTYISAFGEGWGLYAEYLGKEVGFYQDPYSDFGRLTYEMWRACRLVIDTGIHAMGWSRQQAIDYLAGNTALSLHNVTTEVDRYISWPAQALSYKLGEIKIKALRKKAEQTLGEQFDLREFHDQLLKNGAIPLSELEKVIENYISDEQAGK